MEVHRTALWVVMAACCAVVVPYMVVVRLRQARRSEERGPLPLLKAGGDALMTGLGIGLAGAVAILIAAAIVVRLQALIFDA